MLFMNQARLYGRVYREEAGDDGDAGGGEGGESGETDYKAIAEALAAEKEALSNKVNELLGETKRAKEERRKAEKAANEEARKKAEADGNYEQLFKSSESERESLNTQLEQLRHQIESKEISGVALKIASELAEGANVDLLAEFVQRRLKYAENEIKVIDDSGNLTISSIDDLKREFEGSARYASLIKGRKSSGGGANGGSSGGGASKEKSRADFEALDPAGRMKFIKDGGKVIDT